MEGWRWRREDVAGDNEWAKCERRKGEGHTIKRSEDMGWLALEARAERGFGARMAGIYVGEFVGK